MIRNIYLLFLVIFINIFVGCNKNEEYNKELRWYPYNDTLDFFMYKGSEDGAKKITPWDSIKNLKINRDSLKRVYFQKFLNTNYKATLYKEMTIEFLGNKVSYLDSMGIYRIISDYTFENNVLRVMKTNKTTTFVAFGTFNELYRIKGYCTYIKSGKTEYTFINSDKEYNLDKALSEAEYSPEKPMINPSDTIIWCNIKYKFR